MSYLDIVLQSSLSSKVSVVPTKRKPDSQNIYTSCCCCVFTGATGEAGNLREQAVVGFWIRIFSELKFRKHGLKMAAHLPITLVY